MQTVKFAATLGVISMLAAGGTVMAASADMVGPDKVVYHVNNTEEQANDALRNIGNHLEVNPKAHIVVVTHSRGVDFLFDGAKDKNGNPYNITVEQLVAKGVTFDVCEITLKSRKLNKDQFIPEAKFVPSGVGELAKLQYREGYTYVKP
jgi:intracellular sulfur oxidation DsrE/DsrF family protein